MSMLDSFFNRGFQATKCKTQLKLTIPRIKLLRNRRELQIKHMRKDIAKLLETGQEPTARIRVEHIIREENLMAAQEIVELYCELISVRLPIIETQRECPLDLKEAISSVCFAAPRCADLPELQQVQMAFASKYGKEFVAAATGLLPDCGVNRQMIELLSIRAPSSEKKLKLLKDIAKEHGLDWDPEASETELFKSHEDLLNGSNQFISGSKVPLPEEKHVEIQSAHSGSDSTLEMLGFPEVPKVVPTANPYSAPFKDEEVRHPVIPSAPHQEQDEELVNSENSIYQNPVIPSTPHQEQDEEFLNSENSSYQNPIVFNHLSRDVEDKMGAKSDASYEDQIPLRQSSKDLVSPKNVENPTLAHKSSKDFEASFSSISKDLESPKEQNIQFVPFMSAPYLSPQSSLEREWGQGETHPVPAAETKNVADLKDMLLATQQASVTVERAAARPLPAVETESMEDLKDVILATQRAAETAERAAAAARSAVSFAQLKISEVSNRKSEQSSDPISENPFGMGDCDPQSTKSSPDRMNQDNRNTSADSDEGSNIFRNHSSQVDSQTPPNVSSSFPQFDSFGRLSPSSSFGDNTLDRDNSLHGPHRMSSADEESYAYPNLFGSGNQSFKKTSRSNS